ncbi:MAG: hypothetical protein ACFFCS_09015 [Candidatus Hodarchaeota archaeon]
MHYVCQRTTNAIELLEKEIKRDKAEIKHLKNLSTKSPDAENSLEMILFRVKVLGDELHRLKKIVNL